MDPIHVKNSMSAELPVNTSELTHNKTHTDRRLTPVNLPSPVLENHSSAEIKTEKKIQSEVDPPVETRKMSTGVPPKKNTTKDFYFGKIIGEGSFSTVYLVKDVLQNKEYAAKTCNKSFILREKKSSAVMREKEILVLVKDKWNPRAPFFVKLITSFQDEESLYFILTYAERGDFFTFLKRAVKKGINVSRFYSGELVQALEHLHNIGIVHRDLKPENLLLTRDMHILLTDFGSGMILRKEEVDGVEEEITVNRRSSFVGTAQYVSPEMLTSKGCSPASDLWAAGCIIYQMESGSPPFQSGSEYLIFQKILKLEYSFPDQFNSEAADLVKRLLTIEPEKRLGFTDICDHVCYKSIKSHPYFRDLDFENLYRTPSPHLDLYSDLYLEQDPVWDKYPDMTPGLGKSNTDRLFRETLDEPGLTSEEEEEGEQDLSNPCYSLTSQTSCIPESGDMNDLSSEDRNKLLEEQKKKNEYHRFVENNLILKQGLLDKKKGLWSRRRMFLLTEGPRLFYVDPKEKILKGEIPLSAETETEMRDFKTFFVITPDRRYHLTDPQSFGSQWCKAIDGVASYYFKKTVE